MSLVVLVIGRRAVLSNHAGNSSTRENAVAYRRNPCSHSQVAACYGAKLLASATTSM